MITVETEDGGVAGRLAAMGDAVRQALIDQTQALADQLVAAAQARLPAGPLADSIAAEIDGAGARIGSALPYAAALEYGFAGAEQVRETLRRQSVAFGRPIDPRDVLVRAHERAVSIPGRAYLAGALEDMQGDIETAYAAAVDAAMQDEGP